MSDDFDKEVISECKYEPSFEAQFWQSVADSFADKNTKKDQEDVIPW